MAIGSKVVSVFGGPADREAYSTDPGFEAKRVPEKKMSDEIITKNSIYQLLSDMRSMRASSGSSSIEKIAANLKNIFDIVHLNFASEWLLSLEIYELALKYGLKDLASLALAELQKVKARSQHLAGTIDDGIKLATKI